MPAPVVRFRVVGPETTAGPGSGSVDDTALGEAERERRERLVDPDDRAAFVAAHLLVRECAGHLLGVGAAGLEISQSCDTCGHGGHGRPTLVGRDDVHLSLSHTRGCVAAIAAWTPCGIDVEAHHVGEAPSGVLTDREQEWVAAQPDPALAFTTLWVRKEALVKAGMSDLGSLDRLDVLDRVPGARLEAWSEPPYVGAWAVR